MDENNTQNLTNPVAPQTFQAAPVPPVIPQPMQTAPQVTYASFLERFAASIVDSIILTVVGFVLGIIVAIPAAVLQVSLDKDNLLVLLFNLMATVAALIIGYGYYVYFTSKTGATPGKKFLHLKVVDANMQVPSMKTTVVREVLGKIITSWTWLLLGFGYWMMLFSDKKQALHDMVAGTFVIKSD